ncbi:MAG: hypothetical protein K2X99_01645 [Gemmatimonadaceae bacterium]|nr:hypothetical protein [Gemmatimonadaceae bacterium]
MSPVRSDEADAVAPVVARLQLPPQAGQPPMKRDRGSESQTIAGSDDYVPLSVEQRNKYSRSLDLIAKHSPRGEKAVEFRRLLLQAMAAPTRAEYRRVMKPFHDRRGGGGRADVMGAETEGLHATAGFDVRAASESSSGADGVACMTVREGSEVPSECESTFVLSALSSETCTTFWQGETHVDECADEAEVLAFHAELDALSAELSADVAELSALCGGTCYDAEEQAGSLGSPLTAGQGALSSSLFAAYGDAPAPGCGIGDEALQEAAVPANRKDCIDGAVAAVGGAVYWIQEAAGFKGLGARVASIAFKSTQGKLITGAFLIGWGIGSAINCYAS